MAGAAIVSLGFRSLLVSISIMFYLFHQSHEWVEIETPGLELSVTHILRSQVHMHDGVTPIHLAIESYVVCMHLHVVVKNVDNGGLSRVLVLNDTASVYIVGNRPSALRGVL